MAQNTISGHKPPSGKHSNLIAGSVNATDLATGAVTNGKLAANSVGTGKVINNSLTGADIADGSVTGLKKNVDHAVFLAMGGKSDGLVFTEPRQ